jgi:hypothetical protein
VTDEVWKELSEATPTAAELAEALTTVRLHRRAERTTLDDEARRRARAEAAYRASYPYATQEDLDLWVWDPDAATPPLVRGSLRLWEPEPEEPGLSRLVQAS